jgi:hypothetical protein
MAEPTLREAKIVVGAFGQAAEQYKRLLYRLSKSGCTLPSISISEGVMVYVIEYKVAGTADQIEAFDQASGNGE